jgi:hypothetical protein
MRVPHTSESVEAGIHSPCGGSECCGGGSANAIPKLTILNRILSGVLTRKGAGNTETVGVSTADRILFNIGSHVDITSWHRRTSSKTERGEDHWRSCFPLAGLWGRREMASQFGVSGARNGESVELHRVSHRWLDAAIFVTRRNVILAPFHVAVRAKRKSLRLRNPGFGIRRRPG